MSKRLITKEINKIVKQALIEDCALRDVTSDLTIPSNNNLEFSITTREDIIFCGYEIITETFKILQNSHKFKNSKLNLTILSKDGNKIKKGQQIAKGYGNAKLVFAAERVILNLIQILSGISTTTNLFIKTLNDKNITILDTRKTLPNYRTLQKYAVKIGGATNHRFSLSDMILIKDNHIAAAGSIGDAILGAKRNRRNLKIEIECDDLDQVKEAIKHNPDIIMLDNMNISEIKKAIKIINKKSKIEVSGGINIKTIGAYKGLKIDFISVGSLTHSLNSVDIGLDII